MKNLGIAKVKVSLCTTAPKVAAQTNIYNFDVTAHSWNAINTSPIFSPLLTEVIYDANVGFAALHPSKRKYMIDNYMDGTTGMSAAASGTEVKPFISWKPLTAKSDCKGVFNTIITDAKKPADDYPADTPYVNTNSSELPNDWKGPVWNDNNVYREPYPDDTKIIQTFYNRCGIEVTFDAPCLDPVVATAASPIAQRNAIFQKVVRDGLWWAIKSNPFMKEDNTPFWVTIKKPVPPTGANLQTVIIVRLAGDGTDTEQNNIFDLKLTTNERPRFIDYKMPPEVAVSSLSPDSSPTPSTNTGLEIEFPDEDARILPSTDRFEIGFMTVAGRIVVFINGKQFVYTRINKADDPNGGTALLECKIPKGSVEIYGTNIQAMINLSPMSFSPVSCFVAPIPRGEMVDPNSPGGTTTTSVVYKGVTWDLREAPSVCHLPTEPNLAIQRYGCDCRTFNGDGGDATPVGATNTDFHKKGIVTFKKATQSVFTNIPDADFYYVVMKCENLPITIPAAGGGAGTDYDICYSGCPFFFRLKGLKSQPPTFGPSVTDISANVISVEESSAAPDYFHIKKSATVTVYDPGGVISNPTSGPLGKKQRGIEISWCWQDTGSTGTLVKTFTGIITNVTTNQVAGKEIATFTCEDYMYILKQIPIINSPFYDGMVAFYAIKDIVKRMGMGDSDIINDWDTPNDYFLPAGFSFTKPVMRFPSNQNLFDCAINIIKRFEAYMYFDGDGRFHQAKLPGGLFSVPDSGTMLADFTSDPTDADTSSIILGERTVDFNFDSTVNNISIVTLDRDTKSYIVLGKGATSSESKIIFKKSYYLDQPAYGAKEPAKAHMEDLSKRMFFPILKTRWKTAGTNNTLSALDFVTVDGQNFRLTSIKRSFSAESNDFNTSYEAEWLGG